MADRKELEGGLSPSDKCKQQPQKQGQQPQQQQQHLQDLLSRLQQDCELYRKLQFAAYAENHPFLDPLPAIPIWLAAFIFSLFVTLGNKFRAHPFDEVSTAAAWTLAAGCVVLVINALGYRSLDWMAARSGPESKERQILLVLRSLLSVVTLLLVVLMLWVNPFMEW
ncbi:hypothetical protein LTR35_017358 [Friedmanniomyces endolithicus]|nr:hypothetical protein LTR35_017358 [Friedmanniomyces endolithicus]KAK0270438.1 hypothetical protein LTS00_016982 [Friedmanniomyces endolithicus]KAK0974054.1 hypothetical protein LTR54_017183 [Friedmanniomyces endolithicus]